MSCHVIVRTVYPFPWGGGVLLLEPIPALPQGEGRVLQLIAGPSLVSNVGSNVQYLAQGHFDMQLSPARSWDLNQRPSDH